MLSYNPLWKTLIEKNIKRSKMAEDIGLSPTIISNMGKNKSVNLSTIEKICQYLGCRIEDVVEYIPNETMNHPN